MTVNDVGGSITVSNTVMSYYPDFAIDDVKRMENDVILKAIRQGWGKRLVTEFHTRKNPHCSNMNATEFVCIAKVREVDSLDVRVFVPVYENIGMTRQPIRMPDGTRECLHCSGWTYDDRRGNCAACGAPRTSKK